MAAIPVNDEQPATYRLAHQPQVVMTRLIQQLDTFAHLTSAEIACIFSEDTLMVRGAQAWAFVTMPTVQGVQRGVFEYFMGQLLADWFPDDLPEFVIYFDRPRWDGLDDLRRERLVFHELKHIQQKTDDCDVPLFHKKTGEPLLKLVHHDTELFDEELTRYGVEVCEADHTAIAIAQGEDNLRRRRAVAS
jgi:hypothetical protein